MNPESGRPKKVAPSPPPSRKPKAKHFFKIGKTFLISFFKMEEIIACLYAGWKEVIEGS